MAHKPLLLPALRGTLGNWIYYACLMPLREIGERVRYAEEVHPDKALSQLIQRSLEGTRAKNIAEYLTSNTERFFNSLVLATYKGNPEWLEVGNFRSATKASLIEGIGDSAADTLGFFALSGKEQIFAVDGQHRVAGIRRALSDGDEFEDEQLSVLFVGHKNTEVGRRRTRRLFTTLNKTAVPVKKLDIIALDEDDVMAIIVRRLVETNAAFKSPKISFTSSANISSSDRTALTTIANLYDVLKLVFMHEKGFRSDRRLRFNRPGDAELDEYYKTATNFFSALARSFPAVRELFNSRRPENLAGRYRSAEGGHILFRPVGLELFTRVALEFARTRTVKISTAVSRLRQMPVNLDEAPFVQVVWDPARGRMISEGKTVARELMRYIAGLEVDEAALRESYAEALYGDAKRPVSLPAKIKH
jgi:DNA sulfur modification protein DndB